MGPNSGLRMRLNMLLAAASFLFLGALVVGMI